MAVLRVLGQERLKLVDRQLPTTSRIVTRRNRILIVGLRGIRDARTIHAKNSNRKHQITHYRGHVNSRP